MTIVEWCQQKPLKRTANVKAHTRDVFVTLLENGKVVGLGWGHDEETAVRVAIGQHGADAAKRYYREMGYVAAP